MRHIAISMLLAGACTTSTPGTNDTDGAVDTRQDSDPSETGITWRDTASTLPDETASVLDTPIGPTALDGTWTGTFTYLEVGPIGKDPLCPGEVTMHISGDAPRHVSAQWTCTHWEQNTSIGLGYARLDGYTFATLDPADLSRFRLDGAFGARNMQTWEFDSRPMLVDGDTLTLDLDAIVGVGALRSGHKLTASLTREAP